jgi:hypothetical protein
MRCGFFGFSMAKAWIRAAKELDEKPHPNLKKEIFLNIQIIRAEESKLKSLDKNGWKKVISEILHRDGLKTYPEKYPFEKTEEVSVVIYDDEDTEEVFREEAKIPGEYRGEDAFSVDIYD